MNSSDDNINSGDNPQRHHRGMPNNNGGDGRHTVGSLRDLLESLKFDMNGEGGGDKYNNYAAGNNNNSSQYFNGEEHVDDSERGQVFGDDSERGQQQTQTNSTMYPTTESENEFNNSSQNIDNNTNKYGGNARIFHRHSNPNITDDEPFRPNTDDDGDDDDTQSYSGSSYSSSDSHHSYQEAGYDNEEDYLFDQYGGIGGTSEERAELAEALMHTLAVGPMADDLFYEEVAMCFLRCRERHRMRVRREELRERKRARRREKKRQQRAGRSGVGGGVGGGHKGRNHSQPRQQQRSAAAAAAAGSGHDTDVSERISKMNIREGRRGKTASASNTTGVESQSEYEIPDDDDVDDDDSVELSRVSEHMKNINVESDYEDVRARTRRRTPRRKSRGDKADDDNELPEDDDDLSAPSTPMSSSDKDDDDDSFMGGENNDSFDNNGEELNDEEDTAYGVYKSHYNDDNEDDDDEEPHFEHAKQQPHQPLEEPVFRVDLKNGDAPAAGRGKKGQKKKSKFPPPPPPPPPRPPRATATPVGGIHGDAAPMEVDDGGDAAADVPPWEEKMARGARAAAEASAMKNDHESLRREFSIGQNITSDNEVAGGGGGGRGKTRKQRNTISSGSDTFGSSAGQGMNFAGNQHMFGSSTAQQHEHDDYVRADSSTIEPDEDEETNAMRQRVATLRDEGRSYYINGAYMESVLCYTEAIGVHTNNAQYAPSNSDDTLAALHGNRAAALMMTGAYEGASADCDRALCCTENNPITGSLESGPAFRSKILCRMARALLKAGNIWDADKAFNSSILSAKDALATIVASADEGTEERRSMEKILNQSITDATLGLSDVNRYREAAEKAKEIEMSANVSPAAGRRNSVQLLMYINTALSVSPGSMELHERKVNALASLKRWAELGNHCERLAAETVKIDGLFKDDLASMNPFPDIRPASSLKPDFFERNPDDLQDPVSLRILSPKAVCDAVVRLPNGILPLYLRSLRLEERYTEAAKAGASIETHMSNSKHKGSRGNVPIPWLSNERDKLRRTMSWKEKGDTLFRNGDYERAAEKYALCLTIDSDGNAYNHNALENEDAGGRLHAVLHCNRAACLMALKKYREAVKECTAALRIHTHYMKAMLRRGRCFARIRQYQEAIAEYERYIQLIQEARRSPQNAVNSNAACTFDRPIDITETEYSKAKQELADVRKSMRQAAAHDQAQRKKQRDTQFNFNQNFKAAANDAARRQRQEAPPGKKDNANTRKKQWDAGVGSGPQPHRWDTFGGSSPKQRAKSRKEPPAGGKHTSSGPSASRKNQSRSHHHQKQQQQQPQPPPVAKPDVNDHYQVLGLQQTASSAEIKKAYHKMALKYHPDKNSEEGAADIFRRVKLAYEVLGNDQTRIAYDAQRRGRR